MAAETIAVPRPLEPHTDLSPASRTILLTGDRGLIGRWLRRALSRDGWTVRGFDIRDGQDICDAARVRQAARDAGLTIHCAVLPLGSDKGPDEMRRINVEGTENVLAAAEAAGHARVIAFSSAQVFGVLDGERAPVSFPIRDDAPRLAGRPYGHSKVELEDACEAFTRRSGIPSLCFRPVHVWVPGQAADVHRRWRREPSREVEPVWNFGAWIDVRDVVEAVRLALAIEPDGHHRALLAAADAAATRPTVEMTARHHPGVQWTPGLRPSDESTAGVFDCGVARTLLGWEPRFSWAELSRETLLHRLARRLRQPFPP